LSNADLFRKLENLDDITDEDIKHIINAIKAMVAKIRKARGEHELERQE
jgi:hypothetical protein